MQQTGVAIADQAREQPFFGDQQNLRPEPEIIFAPVEFDPIARTFHTDGRNAHVRATGHVTLLGHWDSFGAIVVEHDVTHSGRRAFLSAQHTNESGSGSGGGVFFVAARGARFADAGILFAVAPAAKRAVRVVALVAKLRQCPTLWTQKKERAFQSAVFAQTEKHPRHVDLHARALCAPIVHPVREKIAFSRVGVVCVLGAGRDVLPFAASTKESRLKIDVVAAV